MWKLSECDNETNLGDTKQHVMHQSCADMKKNTVCMVHIIFVSSFSNVMC